jgi:hypothetical protein
LIGRRIRESTLGHEEVHGARGRLSAAGGHKRPSSPGTFRAPARRPDRVDHPAADRPAGRLPAGAGDPGASFIRLLSSPIGAVIVRVLLKPKLVQGQLRQLGHGPSLDAGRIPDAFIECRLALHRETDSMRSERDMVRAAHASGHPRRPRSRLATDEPQSSRRTLTSRLLCPADANVRPSRVLAVGPRPKRSRRT